MTYEAYASAIAGETLPCAFIDLDAVDANVQTLLASHQHPVRLATKSIRAPDLFRHIFRVSQGRVRGLMAFSAREAEFLVQRGFDDILVAYPSVQRADLAALVACAQARRDVSIVVDDLAQLLALGNAARQGGVTIPVVVEADASWRPGKVHIGVRRSPLHSVDSVMELAKRAADTPGLRLHGVMAYEAHVAGMQDLGWKRWLKHLARQPLELHRKAIADAFATAGLPLTVFNGAGTGSLHWAGREPWLTELTAGSGFLDSHLFDYYQAFTLKPAAFFALQVVRHPAPDIMTVHGGGYVASGEAGANRLPIPWLPKGLSLLPLEGVGEVQTPLRTSHLLPIGSPVIFRHAKAGELAEHVNEYVLVRGEKVIGRTKTYRGEGYSFV